MDTGGSLTIDRLPGVQALHELAVLGHLLQVQQPHDLGDLHACGAVLHAILAVGAGDKPHALKRFDGLLQRLFLLRAEGLVLFPFAHVFLYLLQGGHASQHGDDVGQVVAEAVCPGNQALVGIHGLQHVLAAVGQVGQAATARRLHDGYGHAVLLRHFHALAGLGYRVFPIKVVHLQLDEVHIGVLGKQLVQALGVVVHRKAQVPYNTIGLLLRSPFP